MKMPDCVGVVQTVKMYFVAAPGEGGGGPDAEVVRRVRCSDRLKAREMMAGLNCGNPLSLFLRTRI